MWTFSSSVSSMTLNLIYLDKGQSKTFDDVILDIFNYFVTFSKPNTYFINRESNRPWKNYSLQPYINSGVVEHCS